MGRTDSSGCEPSAADRIPIGRHGHGAQLGGQLPVETGEERIPRGGVVESGVAALEVGVRVEDLACAVGGIPVVTEEAWQRRLAAEYLLGAPVREIAVDAAGGRAQAGQYGRAHRVADGRWRLRIGERHAACGKAVKVGSLGLGVAIQIAHPVVQVVDGYEEDIVGLSLLGGQQLRQQHEQHRGQDLAHGMALRGFSKRSRPGKCGPARCHGLSGAFGHSARELMIHFSSLLAHYAVIIRA
jgi:hypothetical protein